MKTKPKKCKVKGCTNTFIQYSSFISWCSPECGYIISQSKLAEKKKIEAVRDKKETQDKRKELMTPSKYVHVYVQPIFNEIARLIDKDLPCVARGLFGKMDGGHYRSVANNTTIRLNMHNIHRQSVYSNRDKGGDNIEYMDGLINEYGQEYFEFIHYKLNQTPTLNLSTKDYMEVRTLASKIRNKLKKEDKTYSLPQRISLRNDINQEIGIYKEEFSVFNLK